MSAGPEARRHSISGANTNFLTDSSYLSATIQPTSHFAQPQLADPLFMFTISVCDSACLGICSSLRIRMLLRMERSSTPHQWVITCIVLRDLKRIGFRHSKLQNMLSPGE